MADKKILELYRFISENYPSNANDIYYSTELLIESVRNTKKSVLKSVQSTENFDLIQNFTEYGKNIEKIENALNMYLDCFVAMSTNDTEDVAEEEDLDCDRNIPNYKDYEVDSEVPHLLTESFTHKRICGFFLNNIRYNVPDWRMTLVKICELLYDKDADLFNEIVLSNRLTGKKIKYFSINKKGEPYRKLKNANIYVWTCHSANAICSLIKRLLLEYEIPTNSLYVYLRADFTPLHNEVGKIKSFIEPIESDDIKIGKFVRETMRKLSVSGYVFDEHMITSLQNDEYTKKTFGVGISFLKEIKEESQLSSLTKDINGYNRYWHEVFDFNGKKFIIISQWTKSNSDRFKNWLNELPV